MSSRNNTVDAGREGLPAGQRPTIRALADRLCVEHHTTVALVDKLEARGFVTRERGRDDRREVFVHTDGAGLALLRRLSALHRAQLIGVGPTWWSHFRQSWNLALPRGIPLSNRRRKDQQVRAK